MHGEPSVSFSRRRVPLPASSPSTRPLFPPYDPSPLSPPVVSDSPPPPAQEPHSSLSPRAHFGTTLRSGAGDGKLSLSSSSFHRPPSDNDNDTHSTFGKFSRWFRGHIHRKNKESSSSSSTSTSPYSSPTTSSPRGLRTRHLAFPGQSESVGIPSLHSLQPSPVTVCFASSAGCDANFLVNSLLKGSFSPSSVSHGDGADEPAFPIDATFLPEESFVRLAPEVFRREQTSSFAKIRKYMKEGVCKFTDASETFILPQERGESCPIIRIEYGTLSELYVRFPSECELRKELWLLHTVESGSVWVPSHAHALLRRQYESVMGFPFHRPPKPLLSPDDLPIPSSILRVLGKTHR